MSQENVEVVRRGLDAWNAGDMDGVSAVYDADAVMRGLEGWPEPGPFVGRDAVMRQWERLRESFDADTLEPVGEIIDAGDRVVARVTWRGSGRGPEMDMEATSVYTFRRKKCVFHEVFREHADAREAAGLSE
jgi:ketosteroid isomerase-like protein